MGTEMRIGIAAGLVIVAATSVYFIYGSDRTDGDLLLTPEKTASADVKSEAKPRKGRTPATSGQPSRNPHSPRPGATTSREVRVANAGAASRTTTNANRTPAGRHTSPAASSTSPGSRVVKPTLSPANRQTPSQGDRTAGATGAPVMTTPTPESSSTPSRATPRTTNASPLVLTKSRDITTAAETRSPVVPPARMPAGSQSTADIKPVSEAGAPGAVASSGAKPTNPAIRNPSTGAGDATKPAGDNRPIRVATRTTGRSTVKPTPMRSGPTAPRVSTRPESGANRPIADEPRSIPPRMDVWPRRHTIASGDTLSDISMQYYGTSRRVDAILKANPEIKGPRSLRIGRQLVIPKLEDVESSSVVKLTSAGDTSRSATVRRATASPVVVAPQRRYTVRKGDTFYSIARELFGSTSRWRELLEANKETVSSPSRLKPGMVLVVPR